MKSASCPLLDIRREVADWTSTAAPVLPIPTYGRYSSVCCATMFAVSKHTQSICPQHSMCGTGKLQREASRDPCSALRPSWVFGVGEYPWRTLGEEILCKRPGNRQTTLCVGRPPRTLHRRWLLPLPFADDNPVNAVGGGRENATFTLLR